MTGGSRLGIRLHGTPVNWDRGPTVHTIHEIAYVCLAGAKRNIWEARPRGGAAGAKPREKDLTICLRPQALFHRDHGMPSGSSASPSLLGASRLRGMCVITQALAD